VAGVQQHFHWLHQLIQVEAGLEGLAGLQVQRGFVGQDDQHIAGVGGAGA